MDSNVMFSGFSPRLLSLEIPQNPQNPVQFQHQHPYPTTTDQQTQPPSQQPIFPYPSKPKQLSPISDDDRGSGSGSGCNPEDSTGTNGKRKFSQSQWHRMKWTDTMVRFLIMAVFYIGDESNDQTETKKKTTTGMLQKKGKWKSVSKAMVEKGFSVSPQQCEDKFNDLNKRYKRVNDILGKGIACRVVENQGLLETMVNVTPKLKNEVRKLLNSKHLFFREMCAYHNSCGHGHGHGHGHNNNNTGEQQQPPPQQNQTQTQHGAESEEEEEEEESESESETEEEQEEKNKKRGVVSDSVKRIREEALRVVEDVGKSVWEKKEWLRKRALEIEEKRVGYEWKAVEMEKQRVKWMRYRSKKEREMEKAKLENTRRRLETERMVLMLRRSEIELTEGDVLGKRVDPSLATG
ncbi:hypothetical protein AALP_AA3G106800 [Arabis alpina]|uniref:Myb/SANT-like DNA-binding domain-containing protein n=1 Tax=Arabis alpina TaxID=50452 RepID=A0A087H8D4_ARAAL|nr:hypothetical protein AALP_AA3G106800 [Arabis alpina]